MGKAGKNLSAFLETIGLKREEIYISNVVKLRPTKESPKTGKAVNRPPSKDEIAFFLPFLQEEIKVVNPQWIVTLGNVPLKAVTGDAKAVIGMASLLRWRTAKSCSLSTTPLPSFTIGHCPKLISKT